MMKITSSQNNPPIFLKCSSHPLELSVSWNEETTEVTSFFSIGWAESPASAQLIVQTLPLIRREHTKSSSGLQIWELSHFIRGIILFLAIKSPDTWWKLVIWSPLQLMEESQAPWKVEVITLLKYEFFPLSVEGILVTDITKHLSFRYLILKFQDHMLKSMCSSRSISVFVVYLNVVINRRVWQVKDLVEKFSRKKIRNRKPAKEMVLFRL